MKTTIVKPMDIVENGAYCPLPLEVIPNYMGINGCNVDAISWQKQEDGQLVNLTIYFLPHNEQDEVIPETTEKDLTNPEKKMAETPMKFIPYLTEEDLADFGEYLLGPERAKTTTPGNKTNVTHADLENWKAIKDN